MYCAYCGHRSPDDALFCQHCGRRLKAADPAKVSQPSQAAPAQSSDILQVGELLCGDFEIIRLISASPEGEVYETRHQFTGQVALVRALPVPTSLNPQMEDRLKAEASALARLSHPSLLSLYNFRREGPRYFAVLQMAEGQPLDGLIRGGGPLPLARFFRIFDQVLDAMAFAHQEGLPHGRLTAEDILVAGGDRVQISGFARFAMGGAAETSRGIAAARYLAPEQIRQHLADERTDLYAIGVAAYYALAGQLPYDATSEFEVMKAHLEQPAPDLRGARPEVTATLSAWVTGALAKDPASRPPSAAAMLEALRLWAVSAGLPMLSGPVSAAPPAPAFPMQQSVSSPAPAPMSAAPAAPASPAADPGLSTLHSERPHSELSWSTRGGDASMAVPSLPEEHALTGAPAASLAPSPSGFQSGPLPGESAVPGHIAYPGLSVPRPAPAPVSAPIQVAQQGPAHVTHEPAPAPMAPQAYAPAPQPAPAPVALQQAPAPMAPQAYAPAPQPAPAPVALQQALAPMAPQAYAPAPQPAPAPVALQQAPAPMAPQQPIAPGAPQAYAPAPQSAPAPVAPQAPAPTMPQTYAAIMPPEGSAPAPLAGLAPTPAAAPAPAPAEQPAPAPTVPPASLMQPAPAPSTVSTPAGGLQTRDGDESDFFFAGGDVDDSPDDFSDLEDPHHRRGRRRIVFFGVLGLAVVVLLGSYWLVGALNPYGRGGGSDASSRPEGWIDKHTQKAYGADPVLRGDKEPGKEPGTDDMAQGPASTGPASTGPASTGPASTGPASTGPASTGPVTTDPAAADPMGPEPMTQEPRAASAEATRLGAEAEKLLRSNRAKAEELAEEALKADPAEPTARKVLADILEAKAKWFLHNGQNAQSVQVARRATELQPERPDPWLYLGVANSELKKATEARAALEQYLKLCPKCANTSLAQQVLRSQP